MRDLDNFIKHILFCNWLKYVRIHVSFDPYARKHG